MLTFYPEFECEPQTDYELILLLDLSNSMGKDEVMAAKRLAILAISLLPKTANFNILVFGTSKLTRWNKAKSG